MIKQLAIATLAAALGACATVPSSLQGRFAATTPRDALAHMDAQPVRWGGRIIKVMPKAESTCFEIMALPLDSQARPKREQDDSAGRFIACHAGFFDPELYSHRRDLTVVGRVTGSEVKKVGAFQYTYPLVEASAIHLWPKRPLYVSVPYYDPWLTGPGALPMGNWGVGAWWGPPRVIIHRHAGSKGSETTPPPAPIQPEPSPRH